MKYKISKRWGLGIGDWGLGPIPNPQSPIPNPHFIFHYSYYRKIKIKVFYCNNKK